MRLAVGLLALTLGGCHLVFDVAPPTPLPPDARFDPDIPLDCPATYASIATASTRSRYRLSSGSSGWTPARQDCADDQQGDPTLNKGYTHALVLSNDMERSGVFVHYQPMEEVWVGMSKVNRNDMFMWLTDEDTEGYPQFGTQAWAPNEPGAGQCVSMLGTLEPTPSALRVRACSGGIAIICECDEHPEDNDNFD